MIGVAIAFLAPWVIAIIGGVWIVRRFRGSRYPSAMIRDRLRPVTIKFGRDKALPSRLARV